MKGWKYKIDLRDVFHNDSLPFEQIRDVVVVRITNRKNHWTDCENILDLDDILDELSETEDTKSFDQAWNDFYDWCDKERVWVETR